MTKNEKEVIQHTIGCLEVYMSVVDKAIDTKKKISSEALNAMAEGMSRHIAELEKIIK